MRFKRRGSEIYGSVQELWIPLLFPWMRIGFTAIRTLRGVWIVHKENSMALTPLPRDANGKPLSAGIETVTKRIIDVSTDGSDITLPVDVKHVLIHVEGSTEIVRFTGTAPGSSQVRITSDGLTLEDVPIALEADTEIITVAAPTGTISVSVIGWR